MKSISPLPMQWSSRMAGGAKSGWLLLGMMIVAASSPILLAAADMPISAVQETLKREQFFFGEPSGVLDEPTRAALRRFQIRYGLPVSGEIDKATLQALQSPRDKDAAGAPVPATATGSESKAGSASTTTIAKDREFLNELQQSGTEPGKAPPTPEMRPPTSAPATAVPAPQATGDSTGPIVGRRSTVEGDTAVPPRAGTPVSVPAGRVVTRTTTTIISDGTTETDEDSDLLAPNGVRIIRPPGTVPPPAPTAPGERARIVEEKRTITVSPTPTPRAPASTSGLPIYPQADEPPSRLQPETPPRKPQGFLQRLFRGDR